MDESTRQYLSDIGRKGGSVKGKNRGNKNAQKYRTDEERKAARREQQRKWQRDYRKKKSEAK